jgi:hypothetical protein
LQVKVVQELVHEAACGQRETPGEMVVEDHHLPRRRRGNQFATGGAAAHEIRGWKHPAPASSSISLSLTQDPSQDPFGKVDGEAPLPTAEPFPFCREALGAILVRIWMNGMVAEQTRNPNLWKAKLGSLGF